MKADKKMNWKTLDNAAKVFPATAKKRDAKVFRCSCELYEAIDPVLLQHAAEAALSEFPLYGYVLRKGIFWYYLESRSIKPIVKQEDTRPCLPLYNNDIKTLLFEVSYYKKRINLEVFHVLSDGTGALQFLRTLVCYYLKRKYGEELAKVDPLMGNDASQTQQITDSFSKYYSGRGKARARAGISAYQIKGPRERENRSRIIEGVVSAGAVYRKAREHQVSVTALLTAVLIEAIHADMSVQSEKKPVAIAIPVNLRKFFKSESMRNFFGLISAGYDYSRMPDDFQTVLRHINLGLREKLTAEQLADRMDTMMALERNIFLQILPLPTKELTLYLANEISSRRNTAALSNMGIVAMPPETSAYIRRFSVIFPTDKLQVCVNTYEDNMSLSFTSPFSDTEIQKVFFRTLVKMGIEVEITANEPQEQHSLQVQAKTRRRLWKGNK